MGWHHSKGSLTLLTNHQSQSEKTSRHIGQSLHGQRRSTPTQVTGNWIAGENVVCLSTWKTFVYSRPVTRPVRLYGLKNKKQRWCLMQFYKVEITFFFLHEWCMWVIWYLQILKGKQECSCINHLLNAAKMSWITKFWIHAYCRFTKICIPDTSHLNLWIKVAFT